MTSFSESPEFLAKVREWNERYKAGGWQSSTAFLTCPRCQFSGLFIVTTVHGETTAGCTGCDQGWTVEP